MKRRPAFTLIEILIVIFIISILTVVVIGSYGAARQKAKADLIADNLINTIKVQQNAAKSGKGTLQCYGIYFDTNPKPNEPEVQTVTSPYVSALPDVDRVDFCDMTQEKLQKLTDMEDFTVDEINAFGSLEMSYLIMFKPPEANVVGGNLLDTPDPLNVEGDSVFEVTFNSQDRLEPRTISFDIATGRAQKTTVAPTAAQ